MHQKKLPVEFRSVIILQFSFDTLTKRDIMKSAFTNTHYILPNYSQSFLAVFSNIDLGRKEKSPHGYYV